MSGVKLHALYEKHPVGQLTPSKVFQFLSGRKKFLLESTVRHEEKGKYSFLGVNPYQEIIGKDRKTFVHNSQSQHVDEYEVDALTYLKRHLPEITMDVPVPFYGGAVGYIGYDVALDMMDLEIKRVDGDMPELHFMLYDEVIVFDHQDETMYFIVTSIEGKSENILQEQLATFKDRLRTAEVNNPIPYRAINFQPEIDKARFKEKVRHVQTFIEAGDVEQVVLSQRMKADIPKEASFPFAFYQSLREANPSPYMFYIDFEDYLILGASPESILQVNGDVVVTNPIAGTRQRGKTREEDLELEAELRTDKKECAEHQMLVELSENDLKKICLEESIKVPISKRIERYEHVMHMVSEVQGSLKEGLTSIDALMANFPAGTVSGSPRKRAMEIINDLEDVRRGAYGGGIGFINLNRDLNIALTIRSLIIKDYIAYLQAGAGIVADSDPDKEFEETLNKAKSIQKIEQVSPIYP